MKEEYKVLWVDFQAEGAGGGKVRLGVAKGQAREKGKGRPSTEDLEFHLVNICTLLPL